MVRRSVSGAQPTLNQVLSNAVTVRQVPEAQVSENTPQIKLEERITIHSDTVAQVCVGENLFAIGDGERRAPAPAR